MWRTDFTFRKSFIRLWKWTIFIKSWSYIVIFQEIQDFQMPKNSSSIWSMVGSWINGSSEWLYIWWSLTCQLNNQSNSRMDQINHNPCDNGLRLGHWGYVRGLFKSSFILLQTGFPGTCLCESDEHSKENKYMYIQKTFYLSPETIGTSAI